MKHFVILSLITFAGFLIYDTPTFTEGCISVEIELPLLDESIVPTRMFDHLICKNQLYCI